MRGKHTRTKLYLFLTPRWRTPVPCQNPGKRVWDYLIPHLFAVIAILYLSFYLCSFPLSFNLRRSHSWASCSCECLLVRCDFMDIRSVSCGFPGTVKERHMNFRPSFMVLQTIILEEGPYAATCFLHGRRASAICTFFKSFSQDVSPSSTHSFGSKNLGFTSAVSNPVYHKFRRLISEPQGTIPRKNCVFWISGLPAICLLNARNSACVNHRRMFGND
jgi:hypothetical protein